MAAPEDRSLRRAYVINLAGGRIIIAPVENSMSNCDINCSLQRTGINRLFDGNLAGARLVAEISKNFG
jgi:hypothetical protein